MAQTVDEKIKFYENHLIHLENNQHRLSIDFVKEEKQSISKLIIQLKLKRDGYVHMA